MDSSSKPKPPLGTWTKPCKARPFADSFICHSPPCYLTIFPPFPPSLDYPSPYHTRNPFQPPPKPLSSAARTALQTDLSPSPSLPTTSKDKDLPTLSSLGHFLKGSSATLGLSKVRDSCEKIQHFGARKEADGNPGHGSDAHYLDLVQRTVEQVKGEYKRVEAKLKAFYGETVVVA